MKKFKTAYDDRDSQKVIFEKPTKTIQSLKKETDINWIIKNFQKTGLMEVQRKIPLPNMEFDNLSYHEALNQIIDAQNEFLELPSHIRAKFDNDPGKFLDAVSEENFEKNRELLQELGLIRKTESFASGASAGAEGSDSSASAE